MAFSSKFSQHSDAGVGQNSLSSSEREPTKIYFQKSLIDKKKRRGGSQASIDPKVNDISADRDGAPSPITQTKSFVVKPYTSKYKKESRISTTEHSQVVDHGKQTKERSEDRSGYKLVLSTDNFAKAKIVASGILAKSE